MTPSEACVLGPRLCSLLSRALGLVRIVEYASDPQPILSEVVWKQSSCSPEASSERAVDADSDFIICYLKNVLTETFP